MNISNIRLDDITEKYSASLAEGFGTLLRIIFDHDYPLPDWETETDAYTVAAEKYYDDFDYTVFSDLVGVDLSDSDNFEVDWRDTNELWLSVKE